MVSLLLKPTLLQICESCIIYKDIEKNISKKLNYEQIHILNKVLKNRKVNLCIEGQEVYIKKFKIPKVNKNKMKCIIVNEVNYYFNYVESILFDYLIFKEKADYIEILVYCLNWNKNNIIKNALSKSYIKKVSLIQFDILNLYKNIIRYSKYAFIFLYNDKLYFLACNKGKLVSNVIIDNFKENIYVKSFNYFMNKYTTFVCSKDNFEIVYFCNFPYKECIKYTNSYFKCLNLGKLNKAQIFNNTIGRRRIWKI